MGSPVNQNTMSQEISPKQKFAGLATSRPLFSLFLFRNLPSALFSGVRVLELNDELCKVQVPYRWFSRNPFRSTYFACLAMAAEMSTGTLALMHIKGAVVPVSMLVLEMNAGFHKKATGKTVFTCKDGHLLYQAIEASIKQQAPQICTATAVGMSETGEKIATFQITWTFKAKAY